MKKYLDMIPRLLIGPIAVVIGLIYFTQQDPPKSICDIQFEIFKQEKNIKKYVYTYEKKNITITDGIQHDVERCESTNSPGGCFDWMEGVKNIIHVTRNIPMQCRDRMDELDPLKKWLDRSIFIFSQVSWNESTIVRKSQFNWLEQDERTCDQAPVTLYWKIKGTYEIGGGSEESDKNVSQMVLFKVWEKRFPFRFEVESFKSGGTSCSGIMRYDLGFSYFILFIYNYDNSMGFRSFILNMFILGYGV